MFLVLFLLNKVKDKMDEDSRREIERVFGPRINYHIPAVLNLQAEITDSRDLELTTGHQKDLLDFEKFLELAEKYGICGSYFVVSDGTFLLGRQNCETKLAKIDYCTINQVALLELERTQDTKHLHAHSPLGLMMFLDPFMGGRIINNQERNYTFSN